MHVANHQDPMMQRGAPARPWQLRSHLPQAVNLHLQLARMTHSRYRITWPSAVMIAPQMLLHGTSLALHTRCWIVSYKHWRNTASMYGSFKIGRAMVSITTCWTLSKALNNSSLGGPQPQFSFLALTGSFRAPRRTHSLQAQLQSGARPDRSLGGLSASIYLQLLMAVKSFSQAPHGMRTSS